MSSSKILNGIEKLPADALFGIKQRYQTDSRAEKVDLGIGAYRDENGKPWVLPSVRTAEKLVQDDPDYNHEYLGIGGLPQLTSTASEVLLGSDSRAINENRVVSVQSLSGTGALHLAAKFISKFINGRTLYLSDPTWANHRAIFATQGIKIATYPYWDASTRSLDLNGYLSAVRSASPGSIFVLHACAHNPTGLDPTPEQWKQILAAIAENDHVALFDSAYQGFASGDLDNDAYAVRLGVETLSKVSPTLICQSFAKNVGMYGERVGCFHVILPEQSAEINSKVSAAVVSQLHAMVRAELSNPPAYGAKVVARIFNTPELRQQWHQDMVTMSSRIKSMRKALRDQLVELKTPGTWDHIVEQCGMFSFTGLNPEMVARLESQHAVYMVSSGRASIAGLNEKNIKHVAYAIDEVVRYHSQSSKL